MGRTICIAIYKAPDVELYEQTLKNCWDANDDGAGFMYNEKGKLHIEKGFFTFDEFMAAYEPHQKKQAVLHFRIKTHGAIDATNCHPFRVDDNLGFVHNGTIASVDTPDTSKSDTWHFNEAVLKPIRLRYKSFFKDDVYKRLLDNYIGWSKLIFLNSQGEYSIVNEKAGEWNSGCWFSNSSWKTPSRYVPKLPEPKKDEIDLDSYEPYNYYNKDTSSYSGSIISMGDICWVKSSYGTLSTGEYVRVKYIYADNTAGVEDIDDDTKEWRMPINLLMKTSIASMYDKYKSKSKETTKFFIPGDKVYFKQNWNHFRKNDQAVIHDTGITLAAPVVIEDPFTHKHYTVPINFLAMDE